MLKHLTLVPLLALASLAVAQTASAQQTPFGGGLNGSKLTCAWIGNTWQCW
jgi:hypothetical protein